MKGCFTTLFLAFIAAIIAAFFGRSCHQERVQDILTQRGCNGVKKFLTPMWMSKYDHLTGLVYRTGSHRSSWTKSGVKSKASPRENGRGPIFNLEEKPKESGQFHDCPNQRKAHFDGNGRQRSKPRRAPGRSGLRWRALQSKNQLRVEPKTQLLILFWGPVRGRRFHNL